MDTALTEPLTTDDFLAWEERQEGKHEFDGRKVIPITGGSVAHQRIVFNLCLAIQRLIEQRPLTVLHAMRIQAGSMVRYPDVTICATPLDQTTRTLTDAVAIFEVLSDDTATTDRVRKLLDYASLTSRRSYVLVEQTAVAATLFQCEIAGPWIASAHTAGAIPLSGLQIEVLLIDVYRGLTFAD